MSKEPIQAPAVWIKARDRLPDDYRPYLCILRGNSQGDDTLRQRVMHFNFRSGVWCENDPSCCVKGMEAPLSDWESVIWWKPLNWPELPWQY